MNGRKIKAEKPSTPSRVKVYLLTDVWVDNGTGYCFPEVLNGNEPYLIVKNELDESDVLLRTKIEGATQFQRQQETLIVWSDPAGQNIALSFQEKAGCASLCDFLIKMNRKKLAPNISLVYIIPTEPEGTEVSEFITGPINYPSLEPTDEDVLDIFHKLNENPSSPYQRECIVKFIESNDYFSILRILFHHCESNKQIKNLHILCNIVKTMILFNEVVIIEQILEDRHILDVVGILEYDPDFPLHKANHRSYLKDESKFKEVLPIDNDEIKALIKKTFKLQFLKDVVLARLLDDPTFNFISSLIHFNHVRIMEYLEKSTFITDLFGLYDHADNLTKKEDGIRLIHQFILISKNLQPHQKTSLYESLVSKGLLRILKFVLDLDSVELRVLSTEVLVSIIEHDVLLVSTCPDEKKSRKALEDRSGTAELAKEDKEVSKSIESNGNSSGELEHSLYEGDVSDDDFNSLEDKSLVLSEDMTLLSMLTGFLLADNSPGLRIQAFEALKSLLDPMNNLNAPSPSSEELFIEKLDTDSYFNAFYSKVAPKLFEPLINESAKDTPEASKKNESLFIHLCELINFCSKDKTISRAFFLENHILLGISKLIAPNHKLQLRLASIRSLKSIILLNDDYYTRYIISNDLLKPVFDLFAAIRESENLVYSTILDLLEIILLELDKSVEHFDKKNFKLLANYIVQNYKTVLETIHTVNSGEDLIKFVEVGTLRKTVNDTDLSIGDVSISQIHDEFDGNDDDSNIGKNDENTANGHSSMVDAVLGKEMGGEPDKENFVVEKRVREDDSISVTAKMDNSSKKITLKHKISSAGKKIASKFSSGAK